MQGLIPKYRGPSKYVIVWNTEEQKYEMFERHYLKRIPWWCKIVWRGNSMDKGVKEWQRLMRSHKGPRKRSFTKEQA